MHIRLIVIPETIPPPVALQHVANSARLMSNYWVAGYATSHGNMYEISLESQGWIRRNGRITGIVDPQEALLALVSDKDVYLGVPQSLERAFERALSLHYTYQQESILPPYMHKSHRWNPTAQNLLLH